MRLLLLLCLIALPLQAATYNLSGGSYPPCSTSWSVSGTTYTCGGNGRVTLNSGDIVLANSSVTISANNGFDLRGAAIGTSTNRINLLSSYGSVISSGTNTLWGNIQAGSSLVNLASTTVNGSITSTGDITLSGGSVSGKVTSSSNKINTNGTNLLGGATAQSGMTLTGGTLAGDFVMTAANPLVLTGVSMTSGSFSGASRISIASSQLGNGNNMISITSTTDEVALTGNSVVYGVLTAPNYSTIRVQSGSSVYGQCIPNSTPTNACTAYTPPPQPLAHYPLDLCSAVSNGVITDLTGNYPATGINVGATSTGQVLQAANLSAAGNDYVNVPAAALNGRTSFSISMWFRLDASSGFRELFSASSNSLNSELELYINNSNEVRAGLKGDYHDFTGGSVSPVVANNRWTQVTLTRTSSQLCLYLDDKAAGCATNPSSASLSVTRSAIGIWWRANGTVDDDFRGDIDEVLLFNQALSNTQVRQMYLNQQAGNSYNGATRSSSCTQCLSDSFASSLSADSWVTSTSSGSFTPQVVNGRLRMTQAVGNQATSATYQRLYPSASNLIIVEFDYWAYGGNGADGLAVVLSDATVTPQPGSFGGPLGYGFKPGIPGFAGGWLGFGLDEYGNFSNEGGSTNIGRRRQAVVVRGSGSGTTGYNYLRGTCNNGTTNTNTTCLSPTVDGNQTTAHRYRFTIDTRTAGSTLVSVERNSGSGFISLIDAFNAQSINGQALPPENFFLSITGSTGGSNNIHELDNLSICALRSSAVGQQIDHFEFDYSGQALTCKPETFTVRACKNASCSELITEPVTATLSPTNSATVNWLGGNVINFSGGQTTVSLRRTEVGSTTIGVSGSIPTTRPLSQTLCRVSSGSLSTAACTISFADSGLVFDVPDGIANLPQQNITISAVRKDNNSLQCVPEFANVTRNVAFWSDYINPDANGRPVSWPVQVNNTNVGLNEANRQAVPLTFNAQGQASFTVNYADAGQMQLNARYSGTAATDDAGLIMNGADQFIRRPLGLCIVTGGECAGADASCPPFRRAGDNFTLTITGRAWQSGSTDICSNPVTPNFQRSAITLNHSLVAPTGGNLGTIGTTSYSHSRNVQAQTQVTQSVSEVGVFRFGSSAFNYLSMTDPVPAATSLPTGRFYPADFELGSNSVTPACSSFSYMAQPFATQFTLTARNVQGVRTQNYNGAFASATAVLQAENSNNGTALGGRLGGTVSPVWSQGVFTYAAPALSFNRANPALPDGPFLQLALAASVVEKDNVAIANQDTNVNTSADCVAAGNCTAKHFATTDIRYGRMALDNAYGPENENLPLVARAEYWNGSAFVTNPQDNCTALSAPAVVRPDTANPALELKKEAPYSGSATMTVNAQASATTVQLGSSVINGLSALLLPAPQQRGSGNMEQQVAPWLQYNWRSGGSNYDQNPQAEFIFGRYRGNPRQIYWRELFQ
jgi:hypothetical protein